MSSTSSETRSTPNGARFTSSSGHARTCNTNSAPPCWRHSTRRRSPTWVNGHRTSAKTSTVLMGTLRSLWSECRAHRPRLEGSKVASAWSEGEGRWFVAADDLFEPSRELDRLAIAERGGDDLHAHRQPRVGLPDRNDA